jgi:hypothetical protein
MNRLWIPLVLALLGLFAFAGSAAATDANGNHASYFWLVGADEPFSDTAIAPDGSTITLSGSGSVTAGPGNTATGGGSYSLRSGGSGTFTVTGVQGFVSYGEAIPQDLPGLFGGEVKLNVSLSNGDSGVMTITCLLGVPPAGKMEGVTVNLGKDGQFTKPAGGDNIFASL